MTVGVLTVDDLWWKTMKKLVNFIVKLKEGLSESMCS